MALDDGWLPIYPSTPPGRGATRSAFTGGMVYGTWEPITNPLPPTELTWQPNYPHRGSRSSSVPIAQRPFLAQGPVFPILQMPWIATYPAKAPKPSQVPIAARPSWFGPNFAFLFVPVTGGWRPIYPHRGSRSAPLLPTGQSVWVVDPATLLAAAPCVVWDETGVTRPTIDAEVLTRPSMTCLTEGAGFLLLEDGGFLLLEDGGKILLEDQTGCIEEALTRSTLAEEALC